MASKGQAHAEDEKNEKPKMEEHASSELADIASGEKEDKENAEFVSDLEKTMRESPIKDVEAVGAGLAEGKGE